MLVLGCSPTPDRRTPSRSPVCPACAGTSSNRRDTARTPRWRTRAWSAQGLRPRSGLTGVPTIVTGNQQQLATVHAALRVQGRHRRLGALRAVRERGTGVPGHRRYEFQGDRLCRHPLELGSRLSLGRCHSSQNLARQQAHGQPVRVVNNDGVLDSQVKRGAGHACGHRTRDFGCPHRGQLSQKCQRAGKSWVGRIAYHAATFLESWLVRRGLPPRGRWRRWGGRVGAAVLLCVECDPPMRPRFLVSDL
jgi:hypothetical protein